MSVPYIIGYPIKDPNNFYGFHGTVKQLYDIVGGRQAQSVSILGLKRSGKTSLLYYLAHRSVLAQYVANPDTYVTLYVDFSICNTPTEFYQHVYHGLLHRLVGLSAPKYEQLTEPDPADITWLLGQFPNRRVMLMLDEFDHLTQGAFDQDFLCQLRSIAIAHDTDLAFITGSFKSLKHIGGSLGLPSTSPFYNIFYPSHLYLSGLSEAQAADLIRCPAEQDGVVFTGEEVENIQAMAGTLPFLLQMSACKMFLLKRNAQSLTQDEFQKGLIEEAGPFFETWWRDLDEGNRLLLSEIAQKESISDDNFQNPMSEEGLRPLKDYGLVVEEEGRLRINGLVLATWVRREIGKQLDKPTIHSSKKTMGARATRQKRTISSSATNTRPKHSKPSPKKNTAVRILHLSDIHLGTCEQADVYRSQLETDLIRELKVEHLEYLVISGDIGTYSTPEEYVAAVELIKGICTRFSLDANRLVIVPGNHDLNWDLSEESYYFVPKRKLPAHLVDGKFIPASDVGGLLLNEESYKKRFSNFSEHFYHQIFGNSYPLEYVDQGIIQRGSKDCVLFLGLNSSWEVDHFYRDRAIIHARTLARALDQLSDSALDNCIKIAVWHHPITGHGAMNDEFMQRLAVAGFQVCLHGHIHEAKQGFYSYDSARGIHVIGAGTFGAPAIEQITGIPLQYNLLVFDPEQRTITVETRKKEKPEGAWSADARWEDKNNPQPRYTVRLK